MARRGSPREQISAGLRFDVLRRCNFACYYCGVPAALGLKVLHVDHVIPVTLGGTNDPWNLVAACWDCNLGKTNTPPTAELVRQVRDEWQGDRGTQGCRIDHCRYCGFPMPTDPENEPDTMCDTCLDVSYEQFRLGFDSGYSRAVRDMDEALEKARAEQ